MKCFFNGCANDCVAGLFKCLFHIHRGKCSFQDGCRNQVYARNLCVRHGGKKQCEFAGCTINSRIGSFCTKHDPAHLIRTCSHDGCSNQAHLRGKCFRHGGSRFCKVDGCVTYARNRGYCTRHTLGDTNNPSPTKEKASPLAPPVANAATEAHAAWEEPAGARTWSDVAFLDSILETIHLPVDWPTDSTILQC